MGNAGLETEEIWDRGGSESQEDTRKSPHERQNWYYTEPCNVMLLVSSPNIPSITSQEINKRKKRSGSLKAFHSWLFIVWPHPTFRREILFVWTRLFFSNRLMTVSFKKKKKRFFIKSSPIYFTTPCWHFFQRLSCNISLITSLVALINRGESATRVVDY